MKRPIAMRCNQEQFDSIKDRINLPILHITSFTDDTYLTNFTDDTYIVTNISFIRNNQEIHETFNADIFLEACGVEVEKVWKGSEMQFRFADNDVWTNCVSDNEYRLKPQPNYSKEIEALQTKAKENGMNVIIKFDKL